MSEYKYRGDSPGKECARTQSYARLRQWQFYNQSHVVIAGDLGDVQYLLRQGVAPNKINVCDIEHSRAKRAKELNGRLRVWSTKDRGADIVDVVRTLVERDGKHTIGSVNVDLCLTLFKGLPVLKRVIELLDMTNTHVFFTFLCGHDPGLRKRASEDNPGLNRLDYFRTYMGRAINNYYAYQSWTRESQGSPMCTAFL